MRQKQARAAQQQQQPPKTLLYACFVAGKKGAPSRVVVACYPNTEPVATKAFQNADSASFHWAPSGRALLIEARTDVDRSGKSYYGQHALHFMRIDGRQQQDANIGS